MTAPLYQQTGKVRHISANGSYMLNRRRCIECDTYRDLMHFAADSRVCYACAAGGRGASEGSAAALPCLNSDNSNGAAKTAPAGGLWQRQIEQQIAEEEAPKLQGRQAKTAFAFEENVKNLIDYVGISNVAFVTLTFPDHVTDPREASRRFNSLNTGFLKQQINGYIDDYELHKSGRIH